MALTPAELRTRANWPDGVPDSYLAPHLASAERDLVRASGLAAAPAGREAEWDDALAAKASALALPGLHLFTQSDVARGIRSLQSNTGFRFLDAAEIDAAVDRLNSRFAELVAALQGTVDADAGDTFAGGELFMGAI